MIAHPERRRHPRFEIAATAFACHAGNYLGQYLVAELSAGGALLLGPRLEVGARLQLLLKWPDRILVSLYAEVVRQFDATADSAWQAVAFRHVAPEIEDRIQAALVADLAQRPRSSEPASVLVVDDCPMVQRALVRDLRALGHSAVCASSLASAVSRLNERQPIRTALIDLFLGHESALDLLRHVGERHPLLRRVLMSGETARLGLAGASGRADAVLGKPWDRGHLEAVLAACAVRDP